MTSPNPKKLFLKFFVLGTVFISITFWYFARNYQTIDQVIDLDAGINRWEQVNSYKRLKARRLGPIEALEFTAERLIMFPLGIGPGMTGAAASLSAEQLKNDPVYDKHMIWAYDNYFLSLIVEFGYGAIFYLLVILSMPLLLFARFRKLKMMGCPYHARNALIAFFSVGIIILGNWGAMGISYNPESFFFWFWCGIGLNSYDIVKIKSS
jgi:hypothetical protein